MFLRPFGLYCSACFGSLFVSILCTCCSHFSWYCFISFTMICAPVFSLIHRFLLSSFVIPSKCLKNFICGASKLCSSLFLSTQASLPNFNAACLRFKVVYLAFDYRLGFTIKKHGFKEVSSFFLIQAQKSSVGPICGDTAKSWVQGMWCV